MRRENKGITVIALIITVIVLMILASISIRAITGDESILHSTNYAAFSSKIRTYQANLDEYITRKEIETGKSGLIIYTSDKDEIKEIIPQISDEDADKFVIQNNELKYKDSSATKKEKEWLAELGVVAAATLFAITYMNKDSVYKTVYADKVVFPVITPTSSDGYFTGWYYDTACTNVAVEGDALTNDITLYAKYDKRDYGFQITYMVNGKMYDQKQEKKIIYPSTEPTIDKRKFGGWFYDEQCKNPAEENTELTGDVILYSKWTSYITNKLNGALFLMEEYSTFGDNNWHKFDNKEDAKNYWSSMKGSYFSVSDWDAVNTPIILKYGAITDGEKIWQYEGGTKIKSTRIISNTYIAGNQWDKTTKCKIDNNGNIINIWPASAINSEKLTIEVTFEDGSTDTDYFFMYTHFMCLAKGTKITLAKHETKKIEEITYDDELLVWDFDNGCFTTAKPLWIMKAKTSKEYNSIKFEDGTELKTIVDHRIFNVDSQKFTYTMNEEDTPIGTRVYKDDGTITRIVDRKVVKEEIEYYNIITDYHMNLFAEGILTSLRLNNLYEIQNMKFVKDNRELTPRNEFENIPDKYFYGLRLAEQPKQINRKNDVKHTNTLNEYVQRLIETEK